MTTILALDTTTTNCSAAILHKGGVVQELSTVPRMHNEKILNMVNELLKITNISLTQVDYIALTTGPGSFTGVRLGLSIAQGLAMGRGIKIIPVSSLHAVAYHAAVKINSGKIVVAFDARMQQIYSSCYDIVNGEIKRSTDDQLLNPQDLFISGNFYAVGDGFLQYKDSFSNLSYEYIPLEPNDNPQAEHVALIAQNMTKYAIGPLEVEPIYLRNNVAQKS